MIKQTYEVTLLSDLCVGDGGVYNSMLDIDVCYNQYGFPYIPAKRMKGCLRESAIELMDWGYLTSEEIELLFGKAGKSGQEIRSGKIRISNAYPENYEAYRREIESCPDHMFYHSQNILGLYTYVRSQTAIESETGTAKRNSLRTLRVVNKDTKFIFSVMLDTDDEVLAEKFTNICKTLRSIGLMRTRGLGEIRIVCIKTEKQNSVKTMEVPDQLDCIRYEITLLEPMICKSINGGESNSLDYIEGNKLMGLLANQCSNKEFLELLNNSNGGLKFSNAYISIDGERLTEVPAYLYSIKNQNKIYVNKLYMDDEFRDRCLKDNLQLNGMKHCYVHLGDKGQLVKCNVKMEERYHHSRPSDKSIGRATDSTESKFYQISSIDEGQTFCGYIIGDPQSLKKVYEKLANVKQCRLGYGNSAEYGLCELNVDKYSVRTAKQTKKVKEIVVKLNAPAIVYSDTAMYTTDVSYLYEEVLAELGINGTYDEVIDKDHSVNYLKYTTVGGFNVSWGERKPVISAFDKGTALQIVFKKEQEIHYSEWSYLGERTAEGYGEYESMIPKQESGVCEGSIVKKSERKQRDIYADIGNLGIRIGGKFFCSYLKYCAINAVMKNSELFRDKCRPTVNNMLLMTIEQEKDGVQEGIESICTKIEERFGKNTANKRDKKEIADQIMKAAKLDVNTMIEDFCKEYRVTLKKEHLEHLDLSEDKLRLLYLRYFLQELKYRIRGGKEENGYE